MYDPRYLDYFELFRQEKFFEAHEILESLWRETKGPEREFYQGLIQLAVALVHYQRGNCPGARTMFESAHRYLSAYPSSYLGVDLEKVFHEFERFLETQKDLPKMTLTKQ